MQLSYVYYQKALSSSLQSPCTCSILSNQPRQDPSPLVFHRLDSRKILCLKHSIQWTQIRAFFCSFPSSGPKQYPSSVAFHPVDPSKINYL
ncbi:hypothetical protein XELAEV_18047602mg [Xenopus laevis]|uniref:Uncharacterized protein n=1 Tax=Xenopus laevis TaxID=8355 RepID=A0A974BV18_XENLA|nr:hypothetical protein XELAEV_18047602mg [Xenopus laevis]